MREIKFRAWYKNKYYYNPELEFVNSNKYYYIRLLNGDRFYVVSTTIDKDSFILEQFTGLRDKNGKDIYEGDILLFKNFHEGWNPKLEINKWDAICVVEWERERSSFSLTEACGNRFGFYRESWFYYEKEIIGNIHENPEPPK